MTSIGAIASASFLTPPSTAQGTAAQNAAHHASAADPDGDGDTGGAAPAPATASGASPATSALNTTA